MSWREERRADRAALAEQVRLNAAAVADRVREDRAVERAEARADRAEARAEQDRRAAARKAAMKSAATWCAGHVQELLFVPVIVVPALLAWTAMAAYGYTLYGPVGWLLPVFSEGAMWVFAAATTLSRRQNPERPTGMLQLGTAVFAAVAGVLNFAHGLTQGPDAGVVMALVSVAGVVAHQIITAGPRRTRAERIEARLARQVARRELRIRSAAVREADAQLASDGTARLIYRPGTVTLSRPWFAIGRPRLAPRVVPGRVPVPARGSESAGEELAAEIADWLATAPESSVGTAQTTPVGTPAGTADDRIRDALAQVRDAITAGRLPAVPSRREVQRFLRCRTQLAGAVARALKDDQDGGAAVPAA